MPQTRYYISEADTKFQEDGIKHFPLFAGYIFNNAAQYMINLLHKRVHADSSSTCPSGSPGPFLQSCPSIQSVHSQYCCMLYSISSARLHCLCWISWDFCQGAPPAYWGPSEPEHINCCSQSFRPIRSYRHIHNLIPKFWYLHNSRTYWNENFAIKYSNNN